MKFGVHPGAESCDHLFCPTWAHRNISVMGSRENCFKYYYRTTLPSQIKPYVSVERPKRDNVVLVLVSKFFLWLINFNTVADHFTKQGSLKINQKNLAPF